MLDKGHRDTASASKLRDMEEKRLHNLFLTHMSGLIKKVGNPTLMLNPNNKYGGMTKKLNYLHMK